jgi:hypothetical protein
MNYITIVIARFTVRIVARVVSAFVYAIKGDPTRALCVACAHAHIAVGLRASQRITQCTFGGSLRPLKFAVTDCTMFCPRNAGRDLVRVIGFADKYSEGDLVEVAAHIEH